VTVEGTPLAVGARAEAEALDVMTAGILAMTALHPIRPWTIVLEAKTGALMAPGGPGVGALKYLIQANVLEAQVFPESLGTSRTITNGLGGVLALYPVLPRRRNLRALALKKPELPDWLLWLRTLKRPRLNVKND
jgi:hypothetical protein